MADWRKGGGPSGKAFPTTGYHGDTAVQDVKVFADGAGIVLVDAFTRLRDDARVQMNRAGWHLVTDPKKIMKWWG